MFQFSHLQLTEILIGYLNASFGSSVYRFYLSLNWFLFQRDDTPVMISCRLIFWEMQMLSATGIFSTSLHHQNRVISMQQEDTLPEHTFTAILQ